MLVQLELMDDSRQYLFVKVRGFRHEPAIAENVSALRICNSNYSGMNLPAPLRLLDRRSGAGKNS